MTGISADWKVRYENLIRDGKIAQVREELSRPRAIDVDRADLVTLANMARRVGLPELTIKLLAPVVRPEFPLREEATLSELAIYASGLARFGAVEESLEILNKIKHHQTAEILLYLSFSYLAQWDYAAAAAPLRKYLKLPEPTEYDKTLAKINLAACYQFLNERTREKHALLQEVTEAARVRRWTRLLRNALELKTQASITEGDWVGAQSALDEAFSLSDQNDLFLLKWRAVLNLKMNGPTPENLREVARVRGLGQETSEPELVRDCDYYLAMETKDQDLMARLYLGTSHRSYKRHLQERAKPWIKLPATYVWSYGESPRIFDLTTGKESGGDAVLKTGQALLRLLQFLASDFYRAFPIGSLFGHLYPGEYFNPDSSPARVRRAIDRLREWFAQHDIPLEIVVNGNHARLRFNGVYGLRLAKGIAHSPERALSATQLSQLREKWPYQGFSAAQAAGELGIATEQARKILAEAEKKKKVRRSGLGRATRYRFSRSGK